MHRTHGLSGTPEYVALRDIIARCMNPKCSQYCNYGARGITVCERWLESPQNFIDDVGRRPSAQHSIERLNNNGNYEPGNCTWATAAEQSNNRRCSIKLTYMGETLSLAEWSRRTGIGPKRLGHRYHKGLTVEQILEPKKFDGGWGKWTTAEIDTIKQLATEMPQWKVGLRFGISQACVSQIVLGQRKALDYKAKEPQ